MQIFKNNNRANPVEYDGPREADGIVSESHIFFAYLGLSFLRHTKTVTHLAVRGIVAGQNPACLLCVTTLSTHVPNSIICLFISTRSIHQQPESFDCLPVGYLKKQAGPATTHITSKASIKSFYEKDVGVIGVFKSNTTKEFKAFQQTADALRSDFEFGHVTEPELVEGATKVPSVLLFKNYDDQSTSYTGKFTTKALTDWIEETTVPQLIEMDQ